jgi:hypothetical protein
VVAQLVGQAALDDVGDKGLQVLRFGFAHRGHEGFDVAEAGRAVVEAHKLPYPLSNVSNILQMRMRRDYYQIEWPQTTRKYQYGVYEDGVLQNYFPPSQGLITNIAPSTP